MCKIAIDKKNEVTVRLQASKEVASYIYPKLKSVEHTGGTENTLNVYLNKFFHDEKE